MSAAAQTLAALRTAVARIEADAVAQPPVGERRIAFGVDEIDRTIGGGLKRGALHAFASASASGSATATGVVAALAQRATEKGRAVLWIRQDMAGLENGEPWGPGLAEIGFDPSRLVMLRAPDADAVLKAAEAGLGCRALGAAVIEPFGPFKNFDRIAGRRLALAAGRSGVLGLLLLAQGQGASSPAGLSAAETRWRVEPLASAEVEDWGRPRASMELVRNRLGALGRWPIEWIADDGRFRLAEPGAERSGADAGAGVAWTTDLGDRLAEFVARPREAEGQSAARLRRAG